MKYLIFIVSLFLNLFAIAQDLNLQPEIYLSAPPASNTCYLAQRTFHFPPPSPELKYEWAYSSTNASWIGVSHDANSGYTFADCGWNSVCTLAGLQPGNHFFAARYIFPNGRRSDWSHIVVCGISSILRFVSH